MPAPRLLHPSTLVPAIPGSVLSSDPFLSARNSACFWPPDTASPIQSHQQGGTDRPEGPVTTHKIHTLPSKTQDFKGSEGLLQNHVKYREIGSYFRVSFPRDHEIKVVGQDARRGKSC
jgi:hypothetical protein